MRSAMYSVVERLYKNKLIADSYLDIAISLNWITTDEKTEILGVQETHTKTV